jgi:hypothetical protein
VNERRDLLLAHHLARTVVAEPFFEMMLGVQSLTYTAEEAMDQSEEYPESAKGMPVPVMIKIMSAIYSELAKDPVMSDPAMHVRQALLELNGLCSLARQVQMENDEADRKLPETKLRKRHRKGARNANCGAVSGEQNACLTPLASLQPYSFLKQ